MIGWVWRRRVDRVDRVGMAPPWVEKKPPRRTFLRGISGSTPPPLGRYKISLSNLVAEDGTDHPQIPHLPTMWVCDGQSKKAKKENNNNKKGGKA